MADDPSVGINHVYNGGSSNDLRYGSDAYHAARRVETQRTQAALDAWSSSARSSSASAVVTPTSTTSSSSTTYGSTPYSTSSYSSSSFSSSVKEKFEQASALVFLGGLCAGFAFISNETVIATAGAAATGAVAFSDWVQRSRLTRIIATGAAASFTVGAICAVHKAGHEGVILDMIKRHPGSFINAGVLTAAALYPISIKNLFQKHAKTIAAVSVGTTLLAGSFYGIRENLTYDNHNVFAAGFQGFKGIQRLSDKIYELDSYGLEEGTLASDINNVVVNIPRKIFTIPFSVVSGVGAAAGSFVATVVEEARQMLKSNKTSSLNPSPDSKEYPSQPTKDDPVSALLSDRPAPN